ncbi:MAG TPA: hypothetical protein VF912_05990 [Anaeromyxobacter sp.]
MSHPGPPAARGHLRLAGPSVERRRVAESRALLLLRAAAGAVALVLLTLFAWTLAALALLPLVLRHAPVGVRLRPLRPREARVIPFERARQKALSR